MYDFPNNLINMTRRTKRFAVLMFLHNRQANTESFSHYSTGLTLAHRLRPSIKLTFLVSRVGLCIFQETSTILLWYIWLLFQYVILSIDKIDYRTSSMYWEIDYRISQQTQDIEPMLFQCRTTICDADPTLKQHWFNVLCLLECYLCKWMPYWWKMSECQVMVNNQHHCNKIKWKLY